MQHSIKFTSLNDLRILTEELIYPGKVFTIQGVEVIDQTNISIAMLNSPVLFWDIGLQALGMNITEGPKNQVLMCSRSLLLSIASSANLNKLGP